MTLKILKDHPIIGLSAGSFVFKGKYKAFLLVIRKKNYRKIKNEQIINYRWYEYFGNAYIQNSINSKKFSEIYIFE